MRKIVSTLVSLITLFLFTAAANALPIEGQHITYKNAGPLIRLADTGNGAVERAGSFSWYIQESGETFSSFCLERNEYISSGSVYEVTGINDYTQSNNSMNDPISKQTNWLMSSFSTGNLDVAGLTQDQIEKNMQVLVWFFEDEIKTEEFNYYAGRNARVTAWYNLANTNVSTWINDDLVKVVNLGTGKQDQLVYGLAPVPEPGTMLLFGLGLIGVASLCRKKFPNA